MHAPFSKTVLLKSIGKAKIKFHFLFTIKVRGGGANKKKKSRPHCSISAMLLLFANKRSKVASSRPSGRRKGAYLLKAENNGKK